MQGQLLASTATAESMFQSKDPSITPGGIFAPDMPVPATASTAAAAAAIAAQVRAQDMYMSLHTQVELIWTHRCSVGHTQVLSWTHKGAQLDTSSEQAAVC